MGTPESVPATCTAAARAGGWSAADNGTYTVSLPGGRVTDSTENAVPATSTTFAVNVLPPGLKPGATDPTFSPATGGRVGVGYFAQASAVAPNGQILVAGQQPWSGGNTSQAVLQRLNADGAP